MGFPAGRHYDRCGFPDVYRYGGLYKTVNRGATWQKLTGNLLDRVTSCTFNPDDPNELYLTTEGQGLWVSKNVNAATPTFSPVGSYPFRQPERVFFNPYDTNEMWVTSVGNGLKMGLMDSPPLPVSLAYFQSSVEEGQIWLKWETASETGSDRFVKLVTGAGTSLHKVWVH